MRPPKTGKGAEVKVPVPAEKKKLPEDLETWVLKAKTDPSMQIDLVPPVDLGKENAVVELTEVELERLCWIGYPYQRAGKGSTTQLNDKGKLTQVPKLFYEREITLMTQYGSLTFECIGIDVPCKCGIYVVKGVYDTSDVEFVVVGDES